MNKRLQAKLDEIITLIDEVEADTKNVSRAEYREFLGELNYAIDVRKGALGPED